MELTFGPYNPERKNSAMFARFEMACQTGSSLGIVNKTEPPAAVETPQTSKPNLAYSNRHPPTGQRIIEDEDIKR